MGKEIKIKASERRYAAKIETAIWESEELFHEKGGYFLKIALKELLYEDKDTILESFFGCCKKYRSLTKINKLMTIHFGSVYKFKNKYFKYSFDALKNQIHLATETKLFRDFLYTVENFSAEKRKDTLETVSKKKVLNTLSKWLDNEKTDLQVPDYIREYLQQALIRLQ